MLVENFVNEYRKLISKKHPDEDKLKEDVDKFLSKHIVNKYIDIERKDSVCRIILENTMYDADGSFKKNSPSRYIQFMLTLIKEYTDIEINSDTVLSEFNMLNKNGLIQLIVSQIPATEYAEFNMIMNMISDDIYDNERDITSFIEKKLNTLSIVADTLMEAYEELSKQNED